MRNGGSVTIEDVRFDRQVRAFGAATQRRLREVRVAVAGAGGAGSLLVQGLAHLGVGSMIVVDDDVVEPTNLNRLVGATVHDAERRRPKVSVAARLARRIDPSARVRAIRGSVLDPDVWPWLRAADVVLGAVDTDAARWALNALAVQYARMLIDVGAEIDSTGDLEVGGHVAVVRPGGPCLRCLSGYEPARAAAQLDPELEQLKRAEGYLVGDEEPAPAVLSLNQVVTGVALSTLVAEVAGWGRPADYVLIDLVGPAMHRLDGIADPCCPVCGMDGVAGLGELAGVPVVARAAPPPVPARQALEAAGAS